ncbi:hypothetical protein ACFX13_036990 [Malus domestica]
MLQIRFPDSCQLLHLLISVSVRSVLHQPPFDFSQPSFESIHCRFKENRTDFDAEEDMYVLADVVARSFRCNLHKNQGGSQNTGSFPSNRLNMCRSDMTNSLVRIGGLEGGGWTRKKGDEGGRGRRWTDEGVKGTNEEEGGRRRE